MTKRRPWSKVRRWSVLALTGFTLSGGCVPDRGQLGAFMGDLLRSAAAALIL